MVYLPKLETNKKRRTNLKPKRMVKRGQRVAKVVREGNLDKNQKANDSSQEATSAIEGNENTIN